MRMRAKRLIWNCNWLFLLAGVVLAADVAAAGLKDLHGREQALSDYTGKGKWLVVMFWASDCHVCNAEAHEYERFHQAHRERNATVLGISLDGDGKRADAEKFVRRHDLSFPNLIGEPEDVAYLYGTLTGAPLLGTPAFLVYGPEGRLLARQAGAVPTELLEEFIRRESAAARLHTSAPAVR